MRNIKYGFLIKDGKIFDTKIQSYELKKKYMGVNLICEMIPNSFKRLYFFEPLLDRYPEQKVFEILNFNAYLKQQRENELTMQDGNNSHIYNMGAIYDYPPSYLNAKKYSLYKICQKLMKRID